MSPNLTLAELRTVSKTARFLEGVSHIGFFAFATACGVLFFIQMQRGWITFSPSFKVLFLAAWCPFFWGQYWTAKRSASRRAWFLFLCALIFSATAILAAVITLIRYAG